ncbi:MAG: hypothetical protein GY847_32205 [Proteobacteria bacterium]|nr:hypothetical protein [Pseudomonadota bacterium]
MKQGLACMNADLLNVVGSVCRDEVAILIWSGEPCPLGPLLAVWKWCWIDTSPIIYISKYVSAIRLESPSIVGDGFCRESGLPDVPV